MSGTANGTRWDRPTHLTMPCALKSSTVTCKIPESSPFGTLMRTQIRWDPEPMSKDPAYAILGKVNAGFQNHGSTTGENQTMTLLTRTTRATLSSITVITTENPSPS